MNWRTDMSLAPRPGYGEGVQQVILAIAGGDRMVVSQWVPQDHANREGGWLNLRPDETPVAWFPVSHPHERSKAPPPAVKLPEAVKPSIPSFVSGV